MAQQTVSRGTCVVEEHVSSMEFSAGALENSSAIIALSDGGMAFFHVAGSDPEHKDNQAGMSGDFERFAVNAKLFYVVFGSYAKNAPTYTTTTIEGYLNDLNGAATILWYKDGVYSRVAVNSLGEITLSVPLDGMHSTGYSGVTGTTAGGMEPVSLGYYLSASSHVQHSTAIPGFSPEQPQSLFDMLEEGQDTAPAETSLVVIDKDETTLNDMQNLQDILLLKSFISVNAMSLMYKRRDNKPYNLDDKVEAAQFVIDQANALNEVTSKSMGGFLNPTKANAYSYEKSIIGAEVHSEILSFLFSSFSLPEKALAQIDGLLSTANSKLSANIKNTHTTLNHMIYVFTFEPVEGLETVKLPVLRQLYLKVDQKSWEASVQAGKSKASVTKFSFKMNVVDSEWEMNPGQVDRQRTQIQDLLTNMTSANLDQINELASPSVIDTADTPTSSASFQITNGELRFHHGTTASQNSGGTSITPKAFFHILTGPTTLSALENNMISIGGSSPSGEMSYWLYQGGTPMENMNGVQTEYFKFSNYDLNFSGSHNFLTHCVEMQYRENIANIGAVAGYTLGNTGPWIMMTGMLSGCTMMFRRTANGVEVAHVQPRDDQTGQQLQQEIAASGAFANSGNPPSAVTLYGRIQYGAGRAHVIGVRKGNGWNFYAQENNGFRVTRAIQIHI